jgi:hypothetical protein
MPGTLVGKDNAFIIGSPRPLFIAGEGTGVRAKRKGGFLGSLQ